MNECETKNKQSRPRTKGARLSAALEVVSDGQVAGGGGLGPAAGRRRHRLRALYGGVLDGSQARRQALHAFSLVFPHSQNATLRLSMSGSLHHLAETKEDLLMKPKGLPGSNTD